MKEFSAEEGQAFIRNVGSGIQGTKETLAEMKRLIKIGARDPVVLDEARNVVGMVAEKDYKAEIDAIFGYVKNRVRYTKDVVGVETISTPRRMVGEIQKNGFAYGDCDDKTTLLGAMLESVGHRTRMVVISQSPKKNFQHVYLEVDFNGKWIPLDATKRDASAGWSTPDYTNKAVFAGNGELQFMAGDENPKSNWMLWILAGIGAYIVFKKLLK